MVRRVIREKSPFFQKHENKTNIGYNFTEKELKKLQQVLLEMLIELDSICKKNEIRYCIIAGTLLGAVRNGGFIPWDDDLDVAMTRDNYIKFRNACKRDLDETKFFFQDNSTDKYYPWGYGRLRRKNTEFVRLGHEHLKMKTGIFLDVFPLDAVPDPPLARGMYTACCFSLRKILYAKVGAVSEKNPMKRGIYKLLYPIPLKTTFRLLKKLRNLVTGQTKYVRIMTFPTPKGRPFGYLRKWYEDLSEIEFEGVKFPCIKRYEQYLTYKYGNYLEEPPIEQRRWHTAAKFELPQTVEEDV